ncbi:MAG: hypothetical protein KAI51_03350, partial [Candidatus Aenigmarchaeota archaeon]|nr:hypothetical protein [Candidatus Aenigmarchaeota archaeon]
MGIKVSLEGRDRITEKYLHCVYDDVAVDIPLYADGQLNKDFALLYYKLEWGLSRFDELASEQIKVIYELIINDEDFYNLDSLFEDGHGSYSFEGFLRFFDEIEEWGDKFNGLTDDASYMHDDDFNDEPVKTQWEESCVPDDSNPHGFSPVQKDIIRFLEDVQSKVYSLNHIANEARLDRDDVFSAVKKLFRGGYLAHKYDTDVKKKQYFLTGKHLNVPGERPLYKFPPAKPQKFE